MKCYVVWHFPWTVLGHIVNNSTFDKSSGPLAHARIWLFPVDANPTGPQGFSLLANNLLGWQPVLTGLVFGGLLLALGLGSRAMLHSPGHVFWGAVVGLSVVSGWVGTAWIANNGFAIEPVETHTFAAPIGDTIFYGMTASGNTLSFSVGSVIGVIAGAVLGSFSKGHFRWEACEDPRELRRQMGGAVLMGFGAVVAVGCSVGQGLSAFSVLAYSAPVTLACIVLGAVIGLRQLVEGFSRID